MTLNEAAINEGHMTDLVIYHAGCLDGFGSAYAAWRAYRERGASADLQCWAAAHGTAPPAGTFQQVFVLDFAYPRALMQELCGRAESVTVLDHHITAAEQLAGLDSEVSNLSLNFDMTQSGAALAWHYFHQTPLPFLLACIQDRDLWRWDIDASADVNAAIMSYPFEFELWHRWVEADDHCEVLAQEGQTINRHRAQMMRQYRHRVAEAEIAGHRVPVVNCPRAIASELLGELAAGHPFAAGYTDQGTRRTWSLRSTASGLNVAEIAALFGGGGHPRAAGFSTELPAALLQLTVTTEPN